MRLLVSLGLKLTRLIDISSVVMLSLFANSLFREDKVASDWVLSLSLGIGGFSLAYLYSLYSKCHNNTVSGIREGKYSEYFAEEVRNNKRGLRLCWFLFIVSIIAIVYWGCCELGYISFPHFIRPENSIIENSIIMDSLETTPPDSLCICK